LQFSDSFTLKAKTKDLECNQHCAQVVFKAKRPWPQEFYFCSGVTATCSRQLYVAASLCDIGSDGVHNGCLLKSVFMDHLKFLFKHAIFV